MKAKAQQSKKRMATAYHEAGHAVAAWCLGVGQRYATIVENEFSAGHVMLDPEQVITFQRSVDICQGNRWDSSRLEAEKWVMVCQAGEVAHRRHIFPGPVRRDRFQSDRSAGFQILHRYAPNEEKRDIVAHYRLLCTWTVSLIEQNWQLVEAVAKALLERRTLSYAQILHVVRGADDEQSTVKVQPLLDMVQMIRKMRDNQM